MKFKVLEALRIDFSKWNLLVTNYGFNLLGFVMHRLNEEGKAFLTEGGTFH
jgi:hypothetical protein